MNIDAPILNRLFGLTACYKANKIDTGSILDIELDENLMKVAFAKAGKTLTEEDDEQETTLDISGLSTISKGNIVEDRIKELIVLYGQGLLNVYRPVIDNGGIDLIVLRHQYFQPIYLQVKSRFNVQEKDQMILTISGTTFRAHHSFYVVGVSFNPNTLEVDDKILFMPSHDVEQMGIRLKHKSNIRIVASYKDSSKGQWSKYFIRKSELVSKLLEKFYEIEKYIK